MSKPNTTRRPVTTNTYPSQRPASTPPSATKAATSSGKASDARVAKEAVQGFEQDLQRKDILILQLEEALSQLRAENKILGGVINDLTSTRSILEKENQKLHREIEKQKKRAWELQNEKLENRHTLQYTNGVHRTILGAEEKSSPALTQIHHVNMTDATRLEIAALEKEISVLRSQLTKSEEEKNAMTCTILELNKELVVFKKENKLRQKHERNDRQIDKDTEMNKEHQKAHIQHLALVSETYRKELLQESERCAELTARLQVIQTEKMNLLKAASKHQKKSESLSVRLSLLTREIADMQLRSRRDLMRDVLEEMEKGLTRDIDREVKKSVIISVLQMELQKEVSLNETLRHSMNDLHEQMKSAFEELNDLRRQHEGALKALSEDISRIQTLEGGRRKELRLEDRAERNCKRLEAELRRMLDHHARCTLEKDRAIH